MTLTHFQCNNVLKSRSKAGHGEPHALADTDTVCYTARPLFSYALILQHSWIWLRRSCVHVFNVPLSSTIFPLQLFPYCWDIYICVCYTLHPSMTLEQTKWKAQSSLEKKLRIVSSRVDGKTLQQRLRQKVAAHRGCCFQSKIRRVCQKKKNLTATARKAAVRFFTAQMHAKWIICHVALTRLKCITQSPPSWPIAATIQAKEPRLWADKSLWWHTHTHHRIHYLKVRW